jgi:phosphate transport system permease protein
VPEFKAQSYVYAAGGIWPCIVGTVLLVVGAMTIALLLGVASAIFLSEYARDSAFVRFIRLAILNLAGVPSIVFGLFGFAMFVLYFDWNVSLMSGWFTLAFMVLPVVITASEEALKAVPKGFREGSLALGATKLQTIVKIVLPNALPGILTGGILAISRAAGEVAPILFTGAAYYMADLPTHLTDQFMDLGYHAFVLSTQSDNIEKTRPILYATVLVLLLLTFSLNAVAIVARARMRRQMRAGH